MKQLGYLVVCLSLAALGCDRLPEAPTAPTPSPALPPPPVPPEPAPVDPQPPGGEPIEVGETVVTRLTAEDHVCDAARTFRCRHYRLRAPASGRLIVAMSWAEHVQDPYPLDFGVIGPMGETVFSYSYLARSRRAELSVAGLAGPYAIRFGLSCRRAVNSCCRARSNRRWAAGTGRWSILAMPPSSFTYFIAYTLARGRHE